jgi:cyclase
MGIKTRVIPVLLWSDHGCVKGRGFDKSRRIGSIQDRIRLLERRDIDELIILDVSHRAPRFDQLKEVIEPLFCPVTVGGGIKSVADIRRILADGADKVAICSEVGLIEEASRKFGAQAISAHVVSSGGETRHWVARARDIEARGAGEIILTSAARDGTMDGYNLDLIRSVTSAVDIPVIACGGCGTYEHMQQALDAGAHAVAAGAMFQFREATPKGAARYLHEHGYQMRL